MRRKKVEPGTRPAISEKVWSSQFKHLFRTLGWEGYHTFFSHYSEHGYPDWTLVNAARKRLVFVELKAEKGKLSEHQEHWRDLIQACGIEWYCWKPSEFDEAVRILKGEPNG